MNVRWGGLLTLALTARLVAAPTDSPTPARVNELQKQGKFTEALAAAQEVRAAAQAKGASHPDALASAHRVGGLRLLLGDPRAADETLAAALKAADANGPASDERAARIVNDLGVARYQRARYQDAKDLFTRALKIRTDRLGDKHADTLQALRNLGWAENALGNVKEARRLFARCRDGLRAAANDPAIQPVSSAEAVLVLEAQLPYPHIRISPGTYVGIEPFNPMPGQDVGAWVFTLDRLAMVEKFLSRKPSGYPAKAVEHARKLFGPTDYRYLVVVTNARPDSAIDAAKLPAPFGPEHPMRASILLRAAERQLRTSPPPAASALADAEAAARLRRDVLGAAHPLTLDADEIVGLIRLALGENAAAATIHEKVLAGRQAVLGKRHPAVAASLGVLGVESYHRGDLPRSRALLEESVAVRTERLGSEDPDTAAAVADLAVVLRQQGDFASARRLLQEALDTLRRTAGPKDFRTLVVGNNLAVVQLEMGDFAAPTRYYQGILAGDYPAFEKEDAVVKLAAIARDRGDLKEARRLYEQVAARKPTDAHILNLLGATCRDTGDLDAAEKLLTRALDLRRAVANADQRPDTAFTLTSYALLRQAQGKYAAAAKEFEEALAIYRRRTGPVSRNTADLASRLGEARMFAADLPGARASLEEALRIKEAWARDQLPNLAEADALGFIAGQGELDLLLTVLSHLPETKVEEAYAAVWATKGMVTRALVARRRVAEDTPEVRAAVADLRRARGRLAALLRSRDGTRSDRKAMPSGYEVAGSLVPYAESQEQFEQLLLQLNADKERAERRLIQVSGSFHRREREWARTPADLGKLLPAGVAVVDIVRVKRWPRKPDGAFEPTPAAVYEAFVLRQAAGPAGLSVTRIDLGSAAPIDQAVADWREMFADARRQPRGMRRLAPLGGRDPKLPPPDRDLRERVWDRIAPALGGASAVVVIPDGAFTRLPFAALPGAKPGTYLVEGVGVVTASYAQQLFTALDQPRDRAGGTLLVGGVAYDARPEESRTGLGYRGAAGVRGGTWKYLPGTAREVERIAGLRPPGLVRLSGAGASKAAFVKSVPGVRYAHVATHGFFADPKLDAVTGRRGAAPTGVADGGRVVEALTGRNPLVLCGLALAGVNAAGNGGTEGLLTAEEVADLDLAGTELVVLSACETGLGTVAGGEGVFGLQRAFALAGARTTVASLWQVDDDATAALMVEFYRRLWGGKRGAGKLEALRAAQLAVLRGEAYAAPGGKTGEPLSPYFWAAFVLAGDWR